MAVILDGKKISALIKDEVRETVKKYRERGIKITLAVVRAGDDPASSIYIRNKQKACEYAGIESVLYETDAGASTEDLLSLILKLNSDPAVNGILVQLPLPPQMDEKKILNAIDSKKDVDGFHPVNVGKMVIGEDGFLPCTPSGIVEMLHRSGIETDGKECVVVGRSNIVGKPMSMLMLRENCTVTIAHSHTKNLKEITSRADILIAAVGKPKMITEDYVKDGAVVIDVGINRGTDKKLCGDVDFDSVFKKASAITPVPGGVGPMTVAMLLKNCVKSVELSEF